MEVWRLGGLEFEFESGVSAREWHDKPESGTIKNDSLLAYDIEGQDKAVFEIVSANPRRPKICEIIFSTPLR